MPLLFVLAGAATWLALRHRSPRAYAGERFKRLMVPFLFGLLVIVPPQGFLAQRIHGGDASIGSFLADYWTVEGDLSGYTGSWTPAHLWFIGSLFVLSMVALPMFARWRTRRVRATWLLFAMPVVLLFADQLPSVEDGTQNPWYALSLFLGASVIADERAQRLAHRHWRALLGVAAGTMATAMLGWSNGVGDRWTGGSEAAFGLLEQVNTWVWVLAVLGVGKAFLGRSGGRVPRYASEGSYPSYLLHQTVIVAVGYVVVGWGIGVWPAFAAVAVGVGGAPGHRPRYCRAMSRPLMADAFGHHVWATLRLIDACLALDPEQLDTAAPGTYGSILDTMRHVVGADAWYLFSLTGGRTPAIHEDRMDLRELRATMEANGTAWSSLLAADPDPDSVVVRRRDDGSETHAPMGIRLAQALHHGTDHRSQICTALTMLGVEPPYIDVWDFGGDDGRVVEVPPTS